MQSKEAYTRSIMDPCGSTAVLRTTLGGDHVLIQPIKES